MRPRTSLLVWLLAPCLAERTARFVLYGVSFDTAKSALLDGASLYAANGYKRVERLTNAPRGSWGVCFVHPRGGPTVETHTVSTSRPTELVVNVAAIAASAFFGERFCTNVRLELVRGVDCPELCATCRISWTERPCGIVADRVDAAAEKGVGESYKRLARYLVETHGHDPVHFATSPRRSHLNFVSDCVGSALALPPRVVALAVLSFLLSFFWLAQAARPGDTFEASGGSAS